MVFHVLNRGVGRMRLFDDDDEYAAFERVLTETLEIQPMRVCAYCVMPNHGTSCFGQKLMATWRDSCNV